MNVLFIVEYKGHPGTGAYMVHPKDQIKKYTDRYNTMPVNFRVFENGKLLVTGLPLAVMQQANKVIKNHGKCYIYYGNEVGWECSLEYREVGNKEYYAGKYEKSDFDILRAAFKALGTIKL